MKLLAKEVIVQDRSMFALQWELARRAPPEHLACERLLSTPRLAICEVRGFFQKLQLRWRNTTATSAKEIQKTSQ